MMDSNGGLIATVYETLLLNLVQLYNQQPAAIMHDDTPDWTTVVYHIKTLTKNEKKNERIVFMREF